MIQVEHNRIELLEHPVIGSFLHMKWNRIGFWYYIFTLVLFVSFLASLSLFSLIVNRPSSAICKLVIHRTKKSICIHLAP